MIYLCSNTSCDDENIVHLELCKIKYASFSVDLSAFSALVISSKNAISALEFNKIPSNNKISVFAIGKASANAASKYGVFMRRKTRMEMSLRLKSLQG